MGLTKKAALAVVKTADELRTAESSLTLAGLDLAEIAGLERAEIEKRRDGRKLVAAVNRYLKARAAHEKALAAAERQS